MAFSVAWAACSLGNLKVLEWMNTKLLFVSEGQSYNVPKDIYSQSRRTSLTNITIEFTQLCTSTVHDIFELHLYATCFNHELKIKITIRFLFKPVNLPSSNGWDCKCFKIFIISNSEHILQCFHQTLCRLLFLSRVIRWAVDMKNLGNLHVSSRASDG